MAARLKCRRAAAVDLEVEVVGGVKEETADPTKSHVHVHSL